MTKYMITGVGGFVARHFLEFLDAASENKGVKILGVDVVKPDFCQSDFKNIDVECQKLDLLRQKDELKCAIAKFQPNYLIHLASFSSVGYSWEHPSESFYNNTNIFLNILEALRESGLKTRVLSVGSSEEYGPVSQQDFPLVEKNALVPSSPYAVARISQEMLSNVYVQGYGMDIVLTRSFNHLGRYQNDRFVIPSFVKQFVQALKDGDVACSLQTGDIDIVRDFVDVRDVVRAYDLLLKKGKAGEVYNVCTGREISLRDVIDNIATLTGLKYEATTSPNLLRPVDNRYIVGSHEKITADLNWEPVFSLSESLQDVIDYWEEQT